MFSTNFQNTVLKFQVVKSKRRERREVGDLCLNAFHFAWIPPNACLSGRTGAFLNFLGGRKDLGVFSGLVRCNCQPWIRIKGQLCRDSIEGREDPMSCCVPLPLMYSEDPY